MAKYNPLVSSIFDTIAYTSVIYLDFFGYLNISFIELQNNFGETAILSSR